jgi:hypothetical protein
VFDDKFDVCVCVCVCVCVGPGREADQSPASSVEVNNGGATPPLLYFSSRPEVDRCG